MGTEARQLELPRIDFSGVDPSAPGAGQWAAVRAQVVDALATFGCFDAHYPALTPDLRAALFDRAVHRHQAPQHLRARQAPVRLPRRHPGPRERLREPRHRRPRRAGARPGLRRPHVARRRQPGVLVSDACKHDLPGMRLTDYLLSSETVHGAAKRIAELEEAARRMLMEGLGVAKYHDTLSESTRHVFRMSRYKAPGGDAAAAAEGMQKQVRYGTHQDCNTLTVVCQHQVDGLEVQARDGDWILVRPSSPASLVVMAGNALRAWTNDRVHAPFHRVTVGGDADRYTALLFAIPDHKIEAPDELVDEEHPRRFKPHYTGEFIRYCVAQGARHQDKLEAFCGM